MKKILAMLLALMTLILCACGTKEAENIKEELVVETRTELGYFMGYVNFNGEDATYVHFLEAAAGSNPVEYKHTGREEVLIISADAQYKSFDLRKSPAPTQDDVTAVTVGLFKDLSLLTDDNRRVVYELVIEGGVIKSAVSQLSLYTDPTLKLAEKYVCDECKQVFASVAEHDAHTCPVAATATPAPTATPTPTPAPTATPKPTVAPTKKPTPTATPRVQCPYCLKWYNEGHDYYNHTCKMVQCPVCHDWFEAGIMYNNHNCIPVNYTKPPQTYCYGCNTYYKTGIEFDTHRCIGNADLVYVHCDGCNTWYLEGSDFLNHKCSGSNTLMYCYGCDSYYTKGIEFDTHYCVGNNVNYVECSACGGWFEEGNIFRNHVCPGTRLIQCVDCGKWYEEGNEFRNHICSGSAPTVNYVECTVCGHMYEEGDAFRNHICSTREPNFVECAVCGGWFEEGNIFRNHICVS